MAFTGAEKAFCVLQFAKCESIVIVQRRFRTQYHKDPPTDKQIRTWYNNFEHTGSLSAGKLIGRPSISVVDVERVREEFTRSPQKSTHRAGEEWQIPQLQEDSRDFIFIMMSVDTSMIHFPIVGLDLILKMTLLYFNGLQGHVT